MPQKRSAEQIRDDSRDASNDGAEHSTRQHGFSAAHDAESNRLLSALPAEEYAALVPHLTPVELELRMMLIEPNISIPHVYFPRVGVCSMIAEEQDGGAVEVGTIGPDGFIGIAVLLGGDSMPYRMFVQIAGDAWRIDADEFRRIVNERPKIRNLLLRYAQYFSDQLSQSVACNRIHTLEERCGRWLLMTHDRVHQNDFELTQEFLALMLGVRRAGVSVAMGVMQGAGIVRYVRGRVSILDRQRLEEVACDCYGITRRAHERLIQGARTG